MPASAHKHPSSRLLRHLRLSLLGGALLVIALAGGTLGFAGNRIASEQSAYAGPRAARCVPARLNRSDLLAHTQVAVSPLPGSYDASPRTQISFLGVPATQIKRVTVVGSSTGIHAGKLAAYSQGDGASFLPKKPFAAGETVTVSGALRAGARGEAASKHGRSTARPRRFSFKFTVAYPDPIPIPKASTPKPPPPGSVQRFHSAPMLQPPTIDVLKDDPRKAAPGDIFVAPYSGPGPNGPVIFAQDGQLVWMDALQGAIKATNFQVERYEGKPVLTWWQGYIPSQGFGLGEEIVANTSYKQILHIKAGNGEMADLHDFHLEPHNTAVLTVFHTIHCDLTSVGGPRDAAVTDGLFQELDVKTGLVRKEWTSVDHVSLRESYSSPLKSSTAWPFDFFHINMIDPREHGSTLLSSRNTSALWLIDAKTGQVVAKVGGKKSTVKMGPGTETGFQHDSITLPDGRISIFDNGGKPWVHSQSRGIVIDLNLHRHTDTLVQEIDHSPPLKAGSQGDVQLQPDRNWFIGWGQEPYFSEYGPRGEVIYDARMWAMKKTFETESYRTFKFPWHATPSWPPALAVGHAHNGLTVYASWNGATEVAAWRVLYGASRAQLRPVATATKRGFETAIEVMGSQLDKSLQGRGTERTYIQVQALDSRGAVIGTSAATEG